MGIETFFYDFPNKRPLRRGCVYEKRGLKKVHRLLTFLDFKVGAYLNLRFQMHENDELNVTPPLSPSYEGRPAVYTGCALCQIHFTGCLKKNVKREKLEKISNIESFKEKGKKWCIKPAHEPSLRKAFLFKRERSCSYSKCF